MEKQLFTVTDLFLALLAVLLISVSFYQTWLGLDQIFGGSSVIIALVLSLILLFLLWQLRLVRLRGGSTTGLGWIYFFFAAFCFVANFNALYTRFMRTDIFTTELREINQKFNDLETDVEAKLNYSVTDPRTRQEIVGEINGLRMQITDPKNQGKGEQSNIIIARIEKKLGGKLTPLTPISNTPQGYADLADRYEQQIIQKIENLSPDEKKLKLDINNAVLKWNKDIQSLLLLSQSEIDDMAQGQIDKSLTEYNKLGNRAHTILGADKFKFSSSLSKTQEVGKIGYAFDHALKNFGMFAFVVLAGCVLLDFGILIIILLMPTDPRNGNTGSVIGTKRVGKTLITK
ncbi:hypothetical protein CLV98_10718 [Dyadobacter jejuensis]|uniref:DUF4407 domain-containing protein n=1 Tax=Dyadobacter jejuensis TaxID=1082580 RepID=A0A316AHY6_9BACT|nr:hypothetical protein [Dyadobacter jejuensis]PWJ57312.1 hypothetical protein CLV98_10718 [Dyadobacter jejuensis]